MGTTSYNHTLMRVKTMDERGLERRMHAIRNARGKHCVTKMRLFARVLFLEGYEDLAGMCVEALEELVAELGDPDEEDMRAAAADIAREERDGANFRCDARHRLVGPVRVRGRRSHRSQSRERDGGGREHESRARRARGNPQRESLAGRRRLARRRRRRARAERQRRVVRQKRRVPRRARHARDA